MTRYILMTAAMACCVFGQGRGRGPVTVTSDLKAKWNQIKSNLTKAADEMPDSAYGAMPEGEPRSFAGWVGHVSDAQARTCSGITGEQLNLGASQMTTKADLVAALKKSIDACDMVFDATTDDNIHSEVSGGFGGPSPREVALYGLLVHSNECYGAMGVYMRAAKLTPPSSAGRGGMGRGRGRGAPKE